MAHPALERGFGHGVGDGVDAIGVAQAARVGVRAFDARLRHEADDDPPAMHPRPGEERRAGRAFVRKPGQRARARRVSAPAVDGAAALQRAEDDDIRAGIDMRASDGQRLADAAAGIMQQL